ncbi:hypothetical protein [Lacipirellula limnantheis]|uniref:DUF4381 domain-containing protein n=1 Tax=Lacipirellula limnantheis TaxID=2528024 RepID=A0A517TZZ6_9BACT|nr:hypothetical protein [Lacipirellula limnantheis]QDT73948.1 hypothetical protein I41_31400 [Lacipirellula limnantheis]
MNDLTRLAWPLAEIGDNFPDSGPRLSWSDLWAYGIALLVAAIVAAAVMIVRRRNDMTIHCENPWKLFRELCLIHDLDHPSRRLLASLAAVRRYEQPAQIFLTPAAFDANDLPEDWQARAGHLRRLKDILFDKQLS